MKVAGVAGPGANRIGRLLVNELSERGRVAWIRRKDETSPDGGATAAERSADTSYVLDSEGYYRRGPHRTVSEAIDDVAPDHDYAVVTGFEDLRIPHVVIGDIAVEGEVITRLKERSPRVRDVIKAVESVEPYETLSSLVDRAKDALGADRAGAIATFTGRVRERDDPDDPKTTRLEFEAYEDVAEERMATIADELEERDGVFSVVMHHRTGVVEAGEDIVFVVVLAGHRAEAFQTVSDGIDRLKAEVPIFKKEVTLEGEFWAHEAD